MTGGLVDSPAESLDPVPGSESFGRESRIRTKADFEQVFLRGFRHASPLMTVYLLASDGDRSRLGLAVSRKVGGAVVRNRVKRRLRESFRRRVRATLPRVTDVVVRAEPQAARAPQTELETALAGAIQSWVANGLRQRKPRPPAPSGAPA